MQMIDSETNVVEIHVSASKLGFTVNDICIDYSLLGVGHASWLPFRTEVPSPPKLGGGRQCCLLNACYRNILGWRKWLPSSLSLGTALMRSLAVVRVWEPSPLISFLKIFRESPSTVRLWNPLGLHPTSTSPSPLSCPASSFLTFFF